MTTTDVTASMSDLLDSVIRDETARFLARQPQSRACSSFSWVRVAADAWNARGREGSLGGRRGRRVVHVGARRCPGAQRCRMGR